MGEFRVNYLPGFDRMAAMVKVVIGVNDGRLLSLAGGPYPVEYRLNEWARPSLHGSLLFVFVDEKVARDYLRVSGAQVKMFGCLALQPVEMIVAGKWYRDYTGFWAEYEKMNAKLIVELLPGSLPSDLQFLPIGTFGAVAVQLLQEIKL